MENPFEGLSESEALRLERKKLREQFKREQRQYFEQFCKNPDDNQTDDEVRADIEMLRAIASQGRCKSEQVVKPPKCRCVRQCTGTISRTRLHPTEYGSSRSGLRRCERTGRPTQSIATTSATSCAG